MDRLCRVAMLATLALVVAACSGAGYGGAGGGAVSSPAPTVAPAASVAPATSVAPAASVAAGSSAGGGSSGGGKYPEEGGTSSPAGGGSTGPGSVQLTGFKFEPAAITVTAGSSLTFTNDDSIGHTVVIGENGTPAAGQTPQPVDPGTTVSMAFGTAGTIKLTCTIHPAMSMTVTVTP